MNDLNNDVRKILEQVYPQGLSNIIIGMLDVLDKRGIKDYIEPLSELIDTDDVDHDPLVRADKIKNIVLNNVIKYLNQRGLIVGDMAHLADIYIVYLILEAMEKLLDLSIGEALFIYSVIEDDTIDNVEKLYLILNYLNPAINRDNFNLLVDNVYDEMFTRLKAVVEDIISNSDIEVDTDDISGLNDDLNQLLDVLINLGYNNAPPIVVDMIVNPEMIKVYYLNADEVFSRALKKIKMLSKEITGSDYDVVIKNDIDSAVIELIILSILRYSKSEETEQHFREILENLEIDGLKDLIPVAKQHIENLYTDDLINALNNIVDKLGLKQMVDENESGDEND